MLRSFVYNRILKYRNWSITLTRRGHKLKFRINNIQFYFPQDFGLQYKLKLTFSFKRHFVRKGGFLPWRGDLSQYQYSTKETTISRKQFDVKNS